MQAGRRTTTALAPGMAVSLFLALAPMAAAQIAPVAPQTGPVSAPVESRGSLVTAAGLSHELAPTARHRYRTTLESETLLAIDVEQLGIDVVIEIRASGAATGPIVDDVHEHEGPEHVRFVAPARGEYDVEIRSEPLPGVTGGRYRLDVLPPRPATESDHAAARRRADAEAALAAIEKAIGNGQVPSPEARVLYDRLEPVVAAFTAERMHRRRAAARPAPGQPARRWLRRGRRHA